jgi:hypothetical protein
VGCPFFPVRVALASCATSDLPMLDRRPAHSSLTPMRRTTRRSGLRAHLAGVAQPAEHLFCKQAVGGSTPPVSSISFDTTSEGCPSGQREQAVNLPDFSYVGSNPTPSTSFGVSAVPGVGRPSRVGSRARRPRRSVMGSAVSVAPIDLSFQGVGSRRGGAVAPRVAYGHRHLGEVGASLTVSVDGAAYRRRHPVEVRASLDLNGDGLAYRSAGGRRSLSRSSNPAGVAQLVEHQPSKLNVVGSSPISRSTSRAARRDLWAGRFVSFVAGAAEARTGAERTSVREHRTGAEAQPPAKIADRRSGRHEATSAHIAQLAERVLGKDEVTSSNLVVGSASFIGGAAPTPGFGAPAPKRNFSVSRANPPHQEGSLE